MHANEQKKKQNSQWKTLMTLIPKKAYELRSHVKVMLIKSAEMLELMDTPS
jgi:hypothetical protein